MPLITLNVKQRVNSLIFNVRLMKKIHPGTPGWM